MAATNTTHGAQPPASAAVAAVEQTARQHPPDERPGPCRSRHPQLGRRPRSASEAAGVQDRPAAWEPMLIGAARDRGVSWAAIAPVLGVASRQAAERRHLRLNPTPPIRKE